MDSLATFAPNLVAVRRLFPKPFGFDDDPTAAGGAVLQLAPDEAAALIGQLMAFPVIVDGQPLAAGPLALVIREWLGSDGEHAGLQAAVRAYAARQRRPRLLQALPLPRLLRPADYTTDAFRAPPDGWYGDLPQMTAGVADAKAALLVRHLRRRRDQLLDGLFDALRTSRMRATGLAGHDMVAVPPALWRSTTVAFDLRSGALVASGVVLFAGIEVQPPARGSTSRAALDCFVERFDASLGAQGRQYTLPELVRSARQALGADVSEREVEAALKRALPSSLAGRGRRAAAITPTPAELRAAATQAAEIRP